MSERTKLTVLAAAAGFFVVVAFGIGLVSMAAFQSDGGTAGAELLETASTGPQSLRLELGDLFIEPDAPQVRPGPLTVHIENTGATDHSFSLGALGSTDTLAPGEKATIEIPEIEVGTYDFFCAVAGHPEAGMKGTLTVAEGTAPATVGPAPMSAEEMVKHDASITAEFPAETEGRGGEALTPRVLPSRTKVYEVTAEAVQWETEPGTFVEAWTYNGTVPGPTLRPRLGDRVRIVLHNELMEPTTIHFHGMTVPAEMDGVPAISQDAVLPGESFTYEFTIRNTGTHMYHSHFNAQKQVPMGLLGAMIVPDRRDPKVALDYPMVLNDGPLGYTLNGKGFPATEPVVVERGDLVRIRYMNEGLLIHPMHLHGMEQRVIAVDGHLLRRPDVEDTVMVAPGDRIDVLVRAAEPGLGRGTATSSTTPRARTGCSAWSPR